MTSGAPRAPLLAVVGGPTGAGKSTLLNSLVRAPVSAAGVLRPTTRRPVLVCNPRDWASVRRHGLNPICAPLMPEGIAVIDAPDLDSIEPGNRAIAEELFAEADLWLFVTTASRYADAAAWRHLRAARERRVALAVVLDRVASGHAQGIIDHMRDLLGPPEPPLFVIPEAPLDRQGMLSDAIAAPLRGWLADVVEAARSGPPRPAIGVAHVAVANIATAADLAPPADPAAAGGPGLSVELELTQADPAPSRDSADFASQPDTDVAVASVPVSPADPTPSDPASETDAFRAPAADPTSDLASATERASDAHPSPADDLAADGPAASAGWPASDPAPTSDPARGADDSAAAEPDGDSAPEREPAVATFDLDDPEPDADAISHADGDFASAASESSPASWAEAEPVAADAASNSGEDVPWAGASPQTDADADADADADDAGTEPGMSSDAWAVVESVSEPDADADGEDYIEYELDLTDPPLTAPDAAPDTDPEAVEGGDGARKGDAEEVAEGEKDGVPDIKAAEDADENPDVVESDPPDGRPADIPKAADVGETVKL